MKATTCFPKLSLYWSWNQGYQYFSPCPPTLILSGSSPSSVMPRVQRPSLQGQWAAVSKNRELTREAPHIDPFSTMITLTQEVISEECWQGGRQDTIPSKASDLKTGPRQQPVSLSLSVSSPFCCPWRLRCTQHHRWRLCNPSAVLGQSEPIGYTYIGIKLTKADFCLYSVSGCGSARTLSPVE